MKTLNNSNREEHFRLNKEGDTLEISSVLYDNFTTFNKVEFIFRQVAKKPLIPLYKKVLSRLGETNKNKDGYIVLNPKVDGRLKDFYIRDLFINNEHGSSRVEINDKDVPLYINEEALIYECGTHPSGASKPKEEDVVNNEIREIDKIMKQSKNIENFIEKIFAKSGLNVKLFFDRK